MVEVCSRDTFCLVQNASGSGPVGCYGRNVLSGYRTALVVPSKSCSGDFMQMSEGKDPEKNQRTIHHGHTATITALYFVV